MRRTLTANFSAEGWVGPESLHLQNKEQELLNFLEEEENENVRRWINQYVSEIEERVESARIAEEREDF